MHRSHLGPCLVGVALAAVLVIATRASAASLAVLVAALACPLSMVVAMRLLMGPPPASFRRPLAEKQEGQQELQP